MVPHCSYHSYTLTFRQGTCKYVSYPSSSRFSPFSSSSRGQPSQKIRLHEHVVHAHKPWANEKRTYLVRSKRSTCPSGLIEGGVLLIACSYTLHLTTTFTSSHVDPYMRATADCYALVEKIQRVEIWSSHWQGQRRFVSVPVGEHCDKMAAGLARTCVSGVRLRARARPNC